MTCRIATIQHGDYREALRLAKSNEPEPYFGQRYSIEYLESFLKPVPHLIIDLNAPKDHDTSRENGSIVGISPPRLPKGVPGSITTTLWAWKIRRRLREFRPTHVLLRTGGILAEQVLIDCKKHRTPTLVLLANMMVDDNPRTATRNRRLIALLNDPIVWKVGNHKQPATQTLIDRGLDPAKAVAYDWPGYRQPSDHPVKALGDPPHRLLFVGTLTRLKGLGDVIDACAKLHARGLRFHLDVVGSGDDGPSLEAQAAALPVDLIRFHGRLANDQVFARMRDATLLVFPSRHEFPEGMPFTLTEALASRTPVVASDHPVIVGGIPEGDGLRYFPAGNPDALAAAVTEVLDDPAAYAELSRRTEIGFRGVECTETMGHLIDEWRAAVGC